MKDLGVFYWIDGETADPTQLESTGTELYKNFSSGQVIVVSTEKHNCGAYDEVHSLFDGIMAYNNEYPSYLLYESEMNGCWQQGHQRPEFNPGYDYSLVDSADQEEDPQPMTNSRRYKKL